MPKIPNNELLQPDLSRLRRGLVECFNLQELEDLCFELNIRYDSLPGQEIGSKARELIGFLQRRGRLFELLEICVNLRPNFSWLEILLAKQDVDGLNISRSSRILSNLPQPDYTSFIGRQKELETIQRLLSPKSRHFVITIDGVGGIGKSALALQIAHRYLDSKE